MQMDLEMAVMIMYKNQLIDHDAPVLQANNEWFCASLYRSIL